MGKATGGIKKIVQEMVESAGQNGEGYSDNITEYDERINKTDDDQTEYQKSISAYFKKIWYWDCSAETVPDLVLKEDKTYGTTLDIRRMDPQDYDRLCELMVSVANQYPLAEIKKWCDAIKKEDRGSLYHISHIGQADFYERTRCWLLRLCQENWEQK